MRHFVQYRNAGERGPLPARRPDLRVFTRKPESFVAGLLGNTVWLIEGTGSPRSYAIRLVFIVDEFGASDNPDFVLYLRGSTGSAFTPPVAIPRTEWFRSFLRRHGNFAFGLQSMHRDDAEVLGRISGWPVD